MRKPLLFRVIVLFVLVMSAFLSAAAPLPSHPASLVAQAQSSSVQVTVDNRTTKSVTLQLKGAAYYNFSVAAQSIALLPVKRGVYTLTLTACGMTATAPLDLTTQKKLIMPICGGSAKQAAKGNPSVVDLSTMIKVVRIAVHNKATTGMTVIFTGPATYVFSLNKNETKEYTVGKGKYTVSYYVCGKYATRTFTADSGKKLELYCPGQ